MNNKIKKAIKSVDACINMITIKTADQFSPDELLELNKLAQRITFFDFKFNSILDELGVEIN